MSHVEVVFWDVQHGHATYVKSPNERHIVIDLGVGSYKDSNETFSPLCHLWHQYGVRTLDYVIITHPHRDHIDDILNFDYFKPKVLRRPKHLTPADVMKDVRDTDREKFVKYFEISDRYNQSIPTDSPNSVRNPANFSGLQIQTFSCDTCPRTNLNNHSVVTVLAYADMKVVVPGDNEACSWDALLKQDGFAAAVRNTDVLLAPHHGRESAFHADFVRLANPRVTAVSDGDVCDTSATSRYSAASRGWEVFRRSGGSAMRRCVTTRTDHAIVVHFGYGQTGNRYLNVMVD